MLFAHPPLRIFSLDIKKPQKRINIHQFTRAWTQSTWCTRAPSTCRHPYEWRHIALFVNKYQKINSTVCAVSIDVYSIIWTIISIHSDRYLEWVHLTPFRTVSELCVPCECHRETSFHSLRTRIYETFTFSILFSRHHGAVKFIVCVSVIKKGWNCH